MKEWMIGSRKLKIIEGNIVTLDVEAIVNAANTSLILGGGVAGAIRNAGGSSIQEECNTIGPVEVGEAVITGAGDLKAKSVIHAVGPVYGEGDEDAKLSKAVLNSLKIAAKHKIKTIAFPAISTGIFHFPIERCSQIMIQVVKDFLENQPFPQEVVICLYDEKAYAVFEKTLDRLKKPAPSLG